MNPFPKTKIAVAGLWHLGSVTATSLAHAGYKTAGFDARSEVVEGLRDGKPPLYEPGLEELLQQGLSRGCLKFTDDAAEALQGASVLWVTYDTLVNENDEADVEFVVQEIAKLLPHLEEGALVLISSQLPVGATRRLEELCAAPGISRGIEFAYVPENLRLGKALSLFAHPDRVIAGIRNDDVKPRIAALFRPFTDHIEWMSVESAEMTKHALNAFLGMSVSFANELAVLCEKVGADAKEVERGLKTEARVGPGAYLSPGAAFAGGTLARDLRFLEQLGRLHGLPMHLIGSVLLANNAHREWPRRRIQEHFGNPRGLTIGLWGLSYKAGTNTLRRSPAVDLASWLFSQGALVKAFDPVVSELPGEIIGKVRLVPTPIAAVESSSVLVVEAAWEDFLAVSADEVASRMVMPRLVLDAGRHLAGTLGNHPELVYLSVGVGAPQTATGSATGHGGGRSDD